MHRRVLQLAILTAVITTQAHDGEKPLFESVIIPDVPHISQRPDFCGEASAEMYLRKLGENMDQDYVFDRSGADPLEGRGAHAAELAHALELIGFNVGPVWIPLESTEELETQFARMHRDLTNEIPSIVCMHFSENNDDEHFRLVLGYDADTDEVIYHEPALPGGSYARMAKERFLDLWALQGKYQWGVIRLILEAGELEYGDAADENTSADYAQHILELRQRIPEEFSVAVKRPFVLISDSHAVELNARAEHIVARAAKLLKKDFFPRNPKDIIDIWLFKDEGSYRFHTSQLFGHEPGTPYGYYSERHNAIILNISTGGGTLVHEMVHPFVEANFPDCPTWLNEGLASLFEHPTTVSGHIRGMVNWRLPFLKRAIRDGSLPTFEWLMTRTEAQFYGEDPGTNYAQSRYLCYFLQEKGLLVNYYHLFYENHKSDPDGISTLKHLMEIDSWVDFQRDWEKWILSLENPNL